MKNLFLGLLLTTALTGCSSGGDSVGGGAGEVNSKISEKGEQALTGQSALFETSRGLSQGQGTKSKILEMVSERSQNIAAANLPDSKAQVQAKAELLNKSMQSTACKIDVVQTPTNGTTGGAAAEIQPFKLKISGASCSVEVLMEMTLIGASGGSPCKEALGAMTCHFNAKVKMSYQVRDEKLANQMGVRSGHMNVAFEVQQTLPSSQSSGMNMEMKAKGNFDFKAVDLEEKPHLISGQQDINVKMVMNAPQPGQASAPEMSGAMKEQLQYLNDSSGVKSNLSATITFKGNEKPDEKYDIDGTSVTAQAYKKERNKFDNSMIVFEASSDKEGNPDQPGPAPGPSPAPQPGPSPSPQPGPAPGPQPLPLPVSQKWACVVTGSGNDVYIGYGSVEFVATSEAKQACQSANSSNCGSAKCEEQEADPQAWYCVAKNSWSGRDFSGTGASKVEAGYFARKDCISKSGSDASSCPTANNDSKCVHQ